MLCCYVSIKPVISFLVSSSLSALAPQQMIASREVIDELTVFYDVATCHLLFDSLYSEVVCSVSVDKIATKQNNPPHREDTMETCNMNMSVLFYLFL